MDVLVWGEPGGGREREGKGGRRGGGGMDVVREREEGERWGRRRVGGESEIRNRHQDRAQTHDRWASSPY